MLNSGVEDKHSILGGDARRYEAILATHGTPYRDFEVEYPPVTLGLVRVLGSGIDVSGIDPVAGEFDGDLGLLTRLAVVQLGFELGAAALLAWAWNRRTGIAYLILGTPFLFFPFPYVRIDLFAVFLAVLALSLMRKGLDRTGGVALAVAALAKLWPLVLAPLLVITDKRRSLVSWAITMAVGLALWLAFFGPSGFAQVATFRGSKGWQIESIPGIFFHMADHGASHVEQGAWRTGVQVPLGREAVVADARPRQRRRWRGGGRAPAISATARMTSGPCGLWHRSRRSSVCSSSRRSSRRSTFCGSSPSSPSSRHEASGSSLASTW